MRKFLKIVCLIILILIMIYMLYLHIFYNRKFYSSLIEISISIFAKFEEIDTHGGFHGDGEALAKIYFNNKQAENFVKKIQNNNHWKELPIDKMTKTSINDITKEIYVPIVENGYSFFLNRNKKAKDKYNYNEIFDNASLNYSIAIFDSDFNILYIYSIDT